jgi:LuxR family quorum-sensing system transcriptional regulator CciR
MKRLVDRFAVEASSCATSEQLHSLLGDACAELGFSHFALLHHASLLTSQPSYIRLDNYPDGWVEELTVTGLGADDPVHLASRRMNTGFAWADLGSIIELGRRQKRILSRSRHFGIDQGFTVPANVPGEPNGSCSFAMRRGRPLPVQRLLCAELIGAHAFQAARRLYRLPDPPERPHLSRRELQCLRLVALGKTDWEIALILGIGLETVRTYVKHARALYGVATRTQLAIHALRDAQISFDDAIPPRVPS